MVDSNNVILFTFLTIIVGIALISPIIQEEFDQTISTYNTDGISNPDMEDYNTSYYVPGLAISYNPFLNFVVALFWVFGMPLWLNLILWVFRIVILVILYDKIRGI